MYDSIETLSQWIKAERLLEKTNAGGYLEADSTKFPLPCGGTLLVVESYYTRSAFLISPTGDIHELDCDKLTNL